MVCAGRCSVLSLVRREAEHTQPCGRKVQLDGMGLSDYRSNGSSWVGWVTQCCNSMVVLPKGVTTTESYSERRNHGLDRGRKEWTDGTKGEAGGRWRSGRELRR